MGANSFLYEMTPFYRGGDNENDRVASPENAACGVSDSSQTTRVQGEKTPGIQGSNCSSNNKLRPGL